MTSQLRSGIVEKKPEVVLEKEVEMDEVYLVAGFKGQPFKVAQKQRKGRRRRLKGKPMNMPLINVLLNGVMIPVMCNYRKLKHNLTILSSGYSQLPFED